jgi:hypothetical protein
MKKHFPIVVVLGCAAVFAFGIVQLFKLRFEAGDVYPAYSSLRADPLGAMAIYESLGKMPGLSLQRDFSTSDRLPEEPHTAYLHLAAEPYEWDFLTDDLFHEIKNFLGRGGRLVITYFPQTTAAHPYFLDDEEKTNSAASPPAKPDGKKTMKGKPAHKKEKSHDEKPWINLENEWGFHESFAELQQDGDKYSPVSVVNKTDLELPRSLDWHSGMIFTNCDAKWQAIYARGKNPVLIERKFGKGSVVIASDSYFLSNEAMVRDRHADLLAWLVGPSRHVVFDEAHFGILDTSGVAALMRKYRLHGLAAGLLLLAVLFIWKNSTSLVPPHAQETREDFVTGKNAASGFVNLLRRNIAPREVFATCFTEWKKFAAPSGKFSKSRVQQAEAIFQSENSLPQQNRDPIATYRKISETLANRKPKL